MWFLKLFFLNILGPKWVGLHTSFGDGSEIPELYLKHVRDVMWKNMVFNRWEQGDILMIDNFRVSHGRQVGQLSVLLSYHVVSHSVVPCGLSKDTTEPPHILNPETRKAPCLKSCHNFKLSVPSTAI